MFYNYKFYFLITNETQAEKFEKVKNQYIGIYFYLNMGMISIYKGSLDIIKSNRTS